MMNRLLDPSPSEYQRDEYTEAAIIYAVAFLWVSTGYHHLCLLLPIIGYH